jgi:Uma2 family endonuclease
MAASTIVPVEEYLGTSYDPDVEYVDGALVERHVGERRHGRLQFPIGVELGPREPGRFHTYTEQRLRVSPQPRYRVPDLCVMAPPYQREPRLHAPAVLGHRDSVPAAGHREYVAQLAEGAHYRYGRPRR